MGMEGGLSLVVKCCITNASRQLISIDCIRFLESPWLCLIESCVISKYFSWDRLSCRFHFPTGHRLRALQKCCRHAFHRVSDRGCRGEHGQGCPCGASPGSQVTAHNVFPFILLSRRSGLLTIWSF